MARRRRRAAVEPEVVGAESRATVAESEARPSERGRRRRRRAEAEESVADEAAEGRGVEAAHRSAPHGGVHEIEKERRIRVRVLVGDEERLAGCA